MKTQKYAGVELPYTIGDWVEVSKVTNLHYENYERKAFSTSLTKDNIGQISKVVSKSTGKIYQEEDFGNIFIPKSKLVFYEVSFSLMNKAVLVKPEDCKLTENHPKRLPLQLGSKWTESDKKRMKEYPEYYPRDEKGRFM